METKPVELTLAQRFAADTPTLFKKIDLIGVALIAIAGSLLAVPGIPIWVSPTLVGIGVTLTTISKLVVKDTSVLANPNATIEDYSKVLADIPNQIQELHAGIRNTVDAINSGKVKPEVPPEETPIVKEPIAIPVGAETIVAQEPIVPPVINPVITEDQTVLQQIAAQQSINPNVTPQN